MSLPNEPYSRIERYLARLAGQEVDIPDKPITRIECYLDYIVNNGGGVPASNAGAHNAAFRGKSLGTSFTSDQADAIAAGTFDGLYIGDYWTIGSKVYRVAGFDIFLGMGSPTAFSAHHAVIVPDASLISAPMNPTDTTEGGYAGSDVFTNVLAQANDMVESAFGEAHVLSHPEVLSTSVSSSGVPTAWAWSQIKCNLLSEGQTFGRSISAPNRFNVGIDYSLFPLFSVAPQFLIAGANYWLKDIVSTTSFAMVSYTGAANGAAASASQGIRPYFCLGGAS